ncbi:MAG: dual specificity protein phosphatase family protein [Anaerolineales bacterium]
MEYSEITRQLYIGTTPNRRDYELLRGLGVRLVINMRFLRGGHPPAGTPSIQYLRFRTIDNPLFPIPIKDLLRGARAGLTVLRDGGKVYVHCARGRHRSIAMAAAVLIASGLSPSEATSLIKRRRAAADPEAAHIEPRILAFSRAWTHSQSARQDEKPRRGGE